MPISSHLPHLRRHLPAIIFLFALTVFNAWNLNRGALDDDEWATCAISCGLGVHPGSHDFPVVFRIKAPDKPVFTAADYEPRKSVRNVVQVAFADNGHAIPYYALLYGWTRLVGFSVFKIRLLSVLLLMAALAVWYAFYQAATGSVNVALGAMVMLALNGSTITLAQYARFYTLILLLAGIATLLVWKLVAGAATRSTGRAVRLSLLLGLLWGLMAVTHYFAGIVVLAQLVFLCSYRDARRLAVPALGAALVPVLLWLFPYGLAQIQWALSFHKTLMHGGHHAFINAITPMGLASGVGASTATLAGFAASHLPCTNTWLNILLALPALLLMAMRLRDRGPAFRLIRLALGAQILTVAAYSIFTGLVTMLIIRYWFFVLPFGVLLLSLALQKFLRSQCARGVRIVAGMVVVLLALRFGATLARHPRTSTPLLPQDPYEASARAALAGYLPGDTVVHQNRDYAQTFNLFMPESDVKPQRIDTAMKQGVVLKRGGQLIPL